MRESIWAGAVIAESDRAAGKPPLLLRRGRQAPVYRREPDAHGLALEGPDQPLHYLRRRREEQGRGPVLSQPQARCDNNDQAHAPLWRGLTEVP